MNFDEWSVYNLAYMIREVVVLSTDAGNECVGIKGRQSGTAEVRIFEGERRDSRQGELLRAKLCIENLVEQLKV